MTDVAYPGSAPISRLFPGDAHVDWTGLDGDTWGTTTKASVWQSFEQVFRPSIAARPEVRGVPWFNHDKGGRLAGARVGHLLRRAVAASRYV